MHHTVFNDVPIYVITFVIFILILLFHWAGRSLKEYMLRKYPNVTEKGLGLTEAAILGLLSLMLGFTFSMTLSKFETRRELMVEEANDIGTAILRCDLYPDSIRNSMRLDFKEYIESRIAYYEAGEDEAKIKMELEKATIISGRIWEKAAMGAQDTRFVVRSNLMIPVLNDMIDIVTTREATRISRVPRLIFWTLLVLLLASAGLLGSDYNYKIKNRFLLFSYAIVMSATLNLILELDRPRQGFINNDLVEEKIEALRTMVH